MAKQEYIIVLSKAIAISSFAELEDSSLEKSLLEHIKKECQIYKECGLKTLVIKGEIVEID